jgi:hypothetical protein
VLTFQALGQPVSIDCDDEALAELLAFNFALMRVVDRKVDDTLASPLTYQIRRSSRGRLRMRCPDQRSVDCEGLADALYALEHDLTVALQRRRPELFFVHAAALEHAGQAYLLAGESGNGKSTTAWGLLSRGFKYLSDELSPIDADTLCVHAYPRALSLKSLPPASHPLPASGVRHLDDTLHIGAEGISAVSNFAVCPVSSVFFVRYEPQRAVPALRRASSAEAGARLYAMTLNALAHANQGLDVALRLASRMDCFVLESADLSTTCDLLCEQIRGTPARSTLA